MLNSSITSLRQVNIFNGQPERRTKPKKKKAEPITQEKFEKNLKTKKLVRNFLENQMSLPVITAVETESVEQKILPVLPDEIFDKKLPDLKTIHRAFKQCDAPPDCDMDLVTLRKTKFKEFWTDSEIFTLHADLLNDSINVLSYEGVPREKNDVLAWIYAEDIQIWHGRRERAEAIPFSFQACCLLCMMDYQVLQNMIYALLDPEYKQLIRPKRFKKAA